MRELLAFGIIALGPGDDFQPRPVHELRFNARDLIERHVVEQKDRLERLHLCAGPAENGLVSCSSGMPAHSLTCANVAEMSLQSFPDQGQPEGGPVFGKQRALLRHG